MKLQRTWTAWTDRISKTGLSKSAVALLLALGCLALTSAPVQAQSGRAPLRYERVTKTTQLRNVASRDGAVVSELAPGTLVAVYEDRSGYQSVEVPGGMGVWIYGKYVRETEVAGVLEITAQNINMRPLPSSDVSSFPLKEKLHRGDRVRMITRAAPERPLDSDWVKVWSPAGTRAWMRTGTTEAVPSSEGQKLWASAVTAASSARPKPATRVPSSVSSQPTNASAAPKTTAQPARPATGATANQAKQAMTRAEAMMADIRAGSSREFAAARAAYEDVVRLAPNSVDAGIAASRLDELTAREDVVRLEADMLAFEERRREEVARAQAELAAAQKSKDPLWGRLQARGWLERTELENDQTAYVIRWAGKITTEVVCTSGRYDLSVFEGFEVGITGVTTRAAIEASLGQSARPVRIDASRIEVISGRYKR